MITAALIFVISAAMLAQFTLFFWRANLLGVASQAVSERMQTAQASFSNAVGEDDFATISAMSEICPNLGATEAKLGSVRLYYQALRGLASLCQSLLPKSSAWAQREMVACTRFLAVSMDMRLKSNEDFLAELRSY
jgi:hypothetical protein